MEGQNVLIGAVVSFVVVVREGCEDEARHEFMSAKDAIGFSEGRGGCFYLKLRELDSGRVELNPGIREDVRVGDLRYGILCSGCQKLTWWEKNYAGHNCLCEDCTDREHEADPDSREQFDREF